MRPTPIHITALALLTLTGSQAPAQSGRATMHCYVAFDGVAHNGVPRPHD